MNFKERDFIPMLFGGDINTYSVARAFYERYKVKSYTFGKFATGPSYQSRIIEYTPNPKIDTDEVFMKTVKSFCSKHADKTVVLVGCGDSYVALISKHKNELPKNTIAPYIDFDLIEKNPKWYLGASDPTNLLFPITCKCDLATVYGFNAGSFDEYGINEYSSLCLDFLKGKNSELHSSSMHQDVDFYNDGAPILNTKTEYVGNCSVSGRLLGGCFESINDMAGTPYDFVKEFNERYKLDGIIWFFDIFSMNSCDVYRALLKMKYMGYFKYTKAILVGRVLFKNVSDLIGYEDAFKKALPDINVVFKVDIGHTYPHMYVVNGAMARVEICDGHGLIQYRMDE